jgi:sulfide dehydrogenase cytochrome subunit
MFRCSLEETMTLRAVGIVCMAILCVAANTARAGERDSVILAGTCFSCHGTDGKSVGTMPPINGKSAVYIAMMLNAYREDKLKGTIMNRIAKGFTIAEIKTLALYFAARK